MNNGFKWLIITDHQGGIDGNWSSAGGYVSQCNMVQAARGIPICPGAEIATTNPPDEHALAYALSETAATIPTNQALAPANLTKAINDHNSPYSYPVIAHPFGGYPWTTWDSTTLQYVKTMELMTGEAVASPSTITKWFELLRTCLPRKIGGGASIVGIGTSDCHNFQDPGYLGFTWAFTTAYGTANRTAIWDAIRSGAVSVSGRKDLGCFSVNSYAQGSVLRLSPGTALTFRLIQQPVTGRKCSLITVYDQWQNVLTTISNPANTETVWSTTSPAADGFYVVKFNFLATDGTLASEDWANPVFIDVP